MNQTIKKSLVILGLSLTFSASAASVIDNTNIATRYGSCYGILMFGNPDVLEVGGQLRLDLDAAFKASWSGFGGSDWNKGFYTIQKKISSGVNNRQLKQDFSLCRKMVNL